FLAAQLQDQIEYSHHHCIPYPSTYLRQQQIVLNIIEVGSQIQINDACLPFHDRLVHSEHRFASCPLRSVSVRPRLEVSFEDRLQHKLERPLDHTVTNGRNRKHADLIAP